MEKRQPIKPLPLIAGLYEGTEEVASHPAVCTKTAKKLAPAQRVKLLCFIAILSERGVIWKRVI